MFRFDDVNHLLDLEVSGSRVFVRADLDGPVDATGEALDDSKLVAAIPTLRWLLDNGARVAVGAHLGPLGSEPGERPSLLGIGGKLAELLDIEVYVPDENQGPIAKKLLSEQRERQLILFENLARDEGERNADEDYARHLIAPFDLYVLDGSFGASPSASLSVAPKLCERRAMGLRLRLELENLNRSLELQPLVWSVGGRFSERQKLLRHALGLRPVILTGADLGATLLAASGAKLPSEVIETKLIPEARTFLERARSANVEVLLPSDFVCQNAGRERLRTPAELEPGDVLLEVGATTLERYGQALDRAASILVLDPLGRSRGPALDQLLLRIAELSQQGAARSLVITGDDLRLDALTPEIQANLSAISTSKHGALALLSGERIPALEALRIPL